MLQSYFTFIILHLLFYIINIISHLYHFTLYCINHNEDTNSQTNLWIIQIQT